LRAPQAEQRKELLTQINQTAQRFFQRQLQSPEGEEALRYFENRGLLPQTIETFALGYAPEGWGLLTQHLLEKGFVEKDICDAGLIKQSDSSNKHHYDRFRHRLIFPIWSTSKRLVGFGGRALRDSDKAKYLNSPEGPLFQKSELLYGMHLAKEAIRRSKHVFLVEGYTDVITMHQYGFQEAVATLGTSLSKEHVKEISRLAKKVTLLFDADKAGYRAAERALKLLLPAGLSVGMLSLPEGEDPDSLVQKIGKPRFEKRIKQATSLTDFLFEHLKEETPPQSLAHKAEFAKQVSTLLNTMPEGIFRELLYQRLAQELDTSLKELNTLNQPSNPKSPPLVRKLPAKYQVLNPTDLAISLLLQNTELAALVASPSSLHFAQHPRSLLLQYFDQLLQ
jgi:DNA primase